MPFNIGVRAGRQAVETTQLTESLEGECEEDEQDPLLLLYLGKAYTSCPPSWEVRVGCFVGEVLDFIQVPVGVPEVTR